MGSVGCSKASYSCAIKVFAKVDAVYNNVVTAYRLAQMRVFNNRYILNVEVAVYLTIELLQLPAQSSIETFCCCPLKFFSPIENTRWFAPITLGDYQDIGLARLSKDTTDSII
jgi:hypothetical protein